MDMPGPTPTISKKKGKSAVKGTKNADNIEVSPVSVKQKNSKHASGLTFSSKLGLRCRLNFDNIKLFSFSTSTQVSSIGELKKRVKEVLKRRDGGSLDVQLQVQPIRIPKVWEKFKFFTFVDHTGVTSIGASVGLFKCIEKFQNTDTLIPPLSIEGKVYFKWSTKTRGELYLTIRDNDASINRTNYANYSQVFSTFHTIRNVIQNAYFVSATILRVIGDCVMFEESEDNKLSLMLQDATSFAIMHFNSINVLEKPSYFPKVQKFWKGKFKFEMVDIDGMPAVAASTSDVFDSNESGTIRNAYPLIEQHIHMVKRTDLSHYEFEICDEVDIRLAKKNILQYMLC